MYRHLFFLFFMTLASITPVKAGIFGNKSISTVSSEVTTALDGMKQYVAGTDATLDGLVYLLKESNAYKHAGKKDLKKRYTDSSKQANASRVRAFVEFVDTLEERHKKATLNHVVQVIGSINKTGAYDANDIEKFSRFVEGVCPYNNTCPNKANAQKWTAHLAVQQQDSAGRGGAGTGALQEAGNGDKQRIRDLEAALAAAQVAAQQAENRAVGEDNQQQAEGLQKQVAELQAWNQTLIAARQQADQALEQAQSEAGQAGSRGDAAEAARAAAEQAKQKVLVEQAALAQQIANLQGDIKSLRSREPSVIHRLIPWFHVPRSDDEGMSSGQTLKRLLNRIERPRKHIAYPGGPLIKKLRHMSRFKRFMIFFIICGAAGGIDYWKRKNRSIPAWFHTNAWPHIKGAGVWTYKQMKKLFSKIKEIDPDEIVEAVTEAAEDVAEFAEDAGEWTVQAIDDTTEFVEDAAEWTEQAVEDTSEFLKRSPVGDDLSAHDAAYREARELLDY